jgi:hypothetical protein
MSLTRLGRRESGCVDPWNPSMEIRRWKPHENTWVAFETDHTTPGPTEVANEQSGID